MGSGAGFDAFLAVRKVGPTGKVYGVDFTDEMLDIANKTKLQRGISNVEFLKGDIEKLPLPDDVADCVISNCVVCMYAYAIFFVHQPELQSAWLYASYIHGSLHGY